MPTFCRHNRFVQNCPICSRQEASTPAPRAARAARASGTAAPRRGGVRVRQAERAADDGYRSELVPGLRASADALRLATELAFSAERLAGLASDPPGLYAEVAAAGDVEEACWLAFQIAYIGPTEGAEPFAAIAAARTSWASGELPALDDAELGPRSAHDRARGVDTLAAYRAWVARAGSQAAAYTGEAAWTPERRFARAFERLALPGLRHAARFDLLVTLGRRGVFDLRAGALELVAADRTQLAAKRVFGIGDPLLLERRAAALAAAAAVPLEALELALWNWDAGEGRATLGLAGAAPADARVRIAAALRA